jgi:aryl-alcohol dehydrogenase-like predicted oxidoreductase
MSIQVPHVAVGSAGLTSPRIALGTMGMTAFYNQDPAATEDESLRTLAASLHLGVNHLDTAWVYHNHATGHHNEELVAKALVAHGRQRFTVATKFFPLAMERGATEDGIRLQLSESLRRLGTSYVDLYYMHRVCSKVSPLPLANRIAVTSATFPQVKVEDVAATMNKLKAEGLVRYVGLSECTPVELRRFHAVCPVSCVQMECVAPHCQSELEPFSGINSMAPPQVQLGLP